MIGVSGKYIKPASVDVIEPDLSDPDNWSVVLIRGEWISVNAPAAVLADRIREALS
jgi:hypothetical protein